MQDSITQVVETRTAELQREAVRLRGERAAIDDRLTKIDGELGELEIAVRVYRRFSPAPSMPGLGLDDPPERDPRGDTGLPDMSDMSLADAAAVVLQTYGPGASRDLRRVLTDAGKLPPSKNSYGYLLKILREKPDRFRKDSVSGKWSLKELTT